MLNFFKNFLVKLLLLPFFALLAVILLIVFLLSPEFKLFKDKTYNKRGKYGYEEKNKDYEPFY